MLQGPSRTCNGSKEEEEEEEEYSKAGGDWGRLGRLDTVKRGGGVLAYGMPSGPICCPPPCICPPCICEGCAM